MHIRLISYKSFHLYFSPKLISVSSNSSRLFTPTHHHMQLFFLSSSFLLLSLAIFLYTQLIRSYAPLFLLLLLSFILSVPRLQHPPPRRRCHTLRQAKTWQYCTRHAFISERNILGTTYVRRKLHERYFSCAAQLILL